MLWWYRRLRLVFSMSVKRYSLGISLLYPIFKANSLGKLGMLGCTKEA